MTSTLAGQLILGADKRNPLFTVYEPEEGEREELHVYYGLELLEVVSAERNDPDFKMLVGRLSNAGVSRRVLQQTFHVDPKTIQRWGRALRSHNADELIRVLEGRKANRKLRPEIQAYVRVRWPDLVKDGLYGIGKRLRQEIQRVFKVKLSQETLRPLLRELKRQHASAGGDAGGAIAESFPRSSPNAPDNQGLTSEAREKVCDCVPVAWPAESAKQDLALEAAPQTLWCDHLGMLLFAPVLVAVAQVVQPAQALFKQWLGSLLLGALNIEQTKFLNWADLSRLLGTVVRFPPSAASGVGACGNPGQRRSAGSLQCPGNRGGVSKPVLLRPAHQTLHRPGERAQGVVCGDPVGGQSLAQRFYPHGGRRAALL